MYSLLIVYSVCTCWWVYHIYTHVGGSSSMYAHVVVLSIMYTHVGGLSSKYAHVVGLSKQFSNYFPRPQAVVY